VPPIAYGLDIETDTGAGGLDPGCAEVLAAAVAGEGWTMVFTGPEPALLRSLDAFLAELPRGVIVTWNGAAFDLPFLSDRAAHCGISTGLRLRLDPTIARRHPPLAGHRGAYRARWYGHRHLDAYRAHRALHPEPELACSLKAVAERAGLEAVAVDRSRVHELPAEDLRRYVESDARLALCLARLCWEDSMAFADPDLELVGAPASLSGSGAQRAISRSTSVVG
jgi:DNA polymerase elongation subunit (family B)